MSGLIAVIRRGVSSIRKTGSAALTGDVTLSAGSNVTLTQTGNDISIASTGGVGGGDLVTTNQTLTGNLTVATGTNAITFGHLNSGGFDILVEGTGRLFIA